MATITDEMATEKYRGYFINLYREQDTDNNDVFYWATVHDDKGMRRDLESKMPIQSVEAARDFIDTILGE